MKKLILLSILLTSFLGMSQRFPLYTSYKWDKSPVLDTLKVPDVLYYYSKYTLAVEYEYDLYDRRFYKYQTVHYRVKLNSHIAIEYFNKVYISKEDVIELKKLKARVVKPNEVKDLDPKVEEFFSEEESEQYYYFPVSGIQLGDEIEILYTLKMDSKVDGDQFQFQGQVPKYNFDFYFVSPDDAFFNFLAHNELPKPHLVDSVRNRNMWHSHLDTMPAFKSEHFTEYNNVTMKLDVVLRGFDSPTDKSYSPYDLFERDLNAVYNIDYSSSDINAAKSLSSRIGITASTSQMEKVRIIENYMKQNISIGGLSQEKLKLGKNIQLEKASSYETILLYMLLFDVNKIDFEFGFISNRYETRFSDEIESAEFLQYFIFHFTDFDGFMAPLYFSNRTGYLDYNWIPNNALMFKMKKYPVLKTQARIVEVKGVESSKNLDSTIIRIRVHEDLKKLDIEIERHLSGYEAGEFQAYYYLYNDLRRAEEEEALLDVLNDYSRFKMTYIDNADPEDAYINPLIIKGIVTELNVSLFDDAGDKLIFRVGNIFGEFTDLKDIYRKQTDFIFANAFTSSKTIFVEFPEGIELKANQEMVDTDDLIPQDDIRIYSHFKLDGNKAVLSHGSKFDKNHYSIDQMNVMKDVFVFWNNLHKYCLLIDKP